MIDVSEQMLIERCRRGDRDAQRALYAQTVDRIYGLLVRMTGNTDDAFDVAQDTYIKAFTSIEQFDGRSSFSTWLYRIAVNEGLQFLRRARRSTARDAAAAAAAGAEGRSTAADVRMDVHDALEGLPPEDQAILLLRYQEGLDYKTIAEITGYAGGTVASRLNRARERLRAALMAGYGPEEMPSPVHPTKRK